MGTKREPGTEKERERGEKTTGRGEGRQRNLGRGTGEAEWGRKLIQFVRNTMLRDLGEKKKNDRCACIHGWQ